MIPSAGGARSGLLALLDPASDLVLFAHAGLLHHLRAATHAAVAG